MTHLLPLMSCIFIFVCTRVSDHFLYRYPWYAILPLSLYFSLYRCITKALVSIMYIIIDRNYTNLSTISKKFTSRINEKHENVFSRPLCRTPLPPKKLSVGTKKARFEEFFIPYLRDLLHYFVKEVYPVLFWPTSPCPTCVQSLGDAQAKGAVDFGKVGQNWIQLK